MLHSSACTESLAHVPGTGRQHYRVAASTPRSPGETASVEDHDNGATYISGSPARDGSGCGRIPVGISSGEPAMNGLAASPPASTGGVALSRR